MSVLLDTSIIIPWLGNVAYARLVATWLSRDQLLISSVSGMELLAGSLSNDQRRKADAFIEECQRHRSVVTPTQDDWLRAGRILARYQNRFGNVKPADHLNDILILLGAERVGAALATENGEDFRVWSRFRPIETRPDIVVLDRQDYLNLRRSP